MPLNQVPIDFSRKKGRPLVVVSVTSGRSLPQEELMSCDIFVSVQI